MTDPTYVLGRTDDEHRRLTEQANLLRPLTERLFRKAGIEQGMRVLDVGSGVGDVAFLLAEIVGPEGSVVGVDLDERALEKARKRAELIGLNNVEFIHGDIRSTELLGGFDAAAGRLVLLYFENPAAALALVAEKVRSGGVIVFQEMEMDEAVLRAICGDTLMGKVCTVICRTFSAAGMHVKMASELIHTFGDAGLCQPELLAEFIVGGGDTFSGYSWAANTVRSLAPLAGSLGVSIEELSDLGTLSDRLRREAIERRMAFWSPPFVGAFSRVDLASGLFRGAARSFPTNAIRRSLPVGDL